MAVVAQPFQAFFFDAINEIDDINLIKATNAAIESGELTPIIKEELKLFIQNRRLSHGQEEMTVTFPCPNKDEKCHVDPEKLTKRREQNREAAKRFRQRMKTKYAKITEELDAEEKKNVELTLKVKRLTILRNSMLETLVKMVNKKSGGIND